MIQSGIFDSSAMDIKKLANSALIFITKRLIEIFGWYNLGIYYYYPLSLIIRRPKFYFPENTQIKNFLGFQGSYTSDLFSINRVDIFFNSNNTYFYRN